MKLQQHIRRMQTNNNCNKAFVIGCSMLKYDFQDSRSGLILLVQINFELSFDLAHLCSVGRCT